MTHGFVQTFYFYQCAKEFFFKCSHIQSTVLHSSATDSSTDDSSCWWHFSCCMISLDGIWCTLTKSLSRKRLRQNNSGFVGTTIPRTFYRMLHHYIATTHIFGFTSSYCVHLSGFLCTQLPVHYSYLPKQNRINARRTFLKFTCLHKDCSKCFTIIIFKNENSCSWVLCY